MYEQKIYVNADNIATTTNTFSDNDLQKLVYSAKSINDYCIAVGHNNWMWLNMSHDDLPGELWRPCPNYPGCNASTFGRIRKNGEILTQYEEHYKNHTPQQIMLLLIAGATNVGWLCVDAGERGGAYHVYNMVADAWLEYDKTSGKHIHHISNNGYDNSPYNLIPLDDATHNNIDHNDSQNTVYPGPKYI